MTGFLDQLTDFLAGAGGSGAPPMPNFGVMQNFGAAPSMASPNVAPAQPQGNILARLRSSTPPSYSNTSSTGPLGITPPIGGNNLAAAMSGLSKVDPTASRFGAFAQGLAGGLAAQGEAQIADRRLGAIERNAGLDALIKEIEIRRSLGQQTAIENAGRIGTNGNSNAYPSGYTGPGADTAPAPQVASPISAPTGPTAPATGPNPDQSSFIASIAPHALSVAQQTGVDPRIVIAQSALETGWGAHAPGNNYFGIKGPGQNLATTETVNGQSTPTTASFSAYPDVAASAQAYADLVKNNPRYAELRSAQGLGPQIAALGRSGYASDPDYATKIGSIASAIPQSALEGAPSPSGASSDQPTVRVSPTVAGTKLFWNRVDPEQNPYFLRYRAGVFDQKAAVPGLPADMANNFARQAQQDRQSALEISKGNTILLRDGRKALMPGALDAETTEAAAMEAAKVHAQKLGEFAAAPAMTPSGTKYLPNPDAPPVATPAPVAAPPTQAQSPATGPAAPGAALAQTLGRAVLDPDTGAVTTAIPKAPAGGGYPAPEGLPPGAKMMDLSPAGKAVQDADKEYYTAMGNAPALDQTIEKFGAMGQAFKLFESGSGAEKLQGAAAIAQSFGRKDLAQKILGGDPDAYQWVEKEGAPLALNQLKSATTRFTQAEFKTTYDTSIPNPEKLPQANHQMIAEGLAAARAQKQFNSDWQQAQQQGWQSPSAFYQFWVKANPSAMFIQSAQKQLGNFKGMDLPPPTDWTKGVTYTAPKDMTPQQHAVFDKYGLKPGAMFRFNGWKSGAPVAPIDDAHKFSSHLETQQ